MHDVRMLTDSWAKKTFEEELLSVDCKDKILLRNLLRELNALGIKDKCVNGYACEGLPKTEEGRTVARISYTDVFHELYLGNNLCPTKYLLRLTELFIENNGQKPKLTGFLSRGLRSLTSFLREPDFAYNILKILRETDPASIAELGSRQDSSDHTDVLIKYRDNIYRLWLFQFSDRGLPHDIDRITGRRGELPSGIHLLCPLTTERAIAYDKCLKRKQNVAKKIENVKDQLNDCTDRAVVKKSRLLQRADGYKKELQELNKLIAENKQKCAPELDIVNGWYFYSKQHIKRISSIIQTPGNVLSYKQTVEILEAPKNFLSSPKIFIK